MMALVAYIDMLAKATERKPIPIYLYHFPAMSGLPWHVKLVERLLETRFPSRVVGLVRSSRATWAYALGGPRRYHPDFGGIPVDRGMLDRGPLRCFRRLHLGDRQPQCRSVRTGLEQVRYLGALDAAVTSPANCSTATRCSRGSRRCLLYIHGDAGSARVLAAAGAVLGCRPSGCHRRARCNAGQTRRLRQRYRGVDAHAQPYYKPQPWRRILSPPQLFVKPSRFREYPPKAPAANENLLANTKFRP